MAYDLLVTALLAGWAALLDYISAHVLFSIIPAFFLAGAIATLLRRETVMKYLGPDAKKSVSYLVAAGGGILLSVCSCTILPLFTGIYKRGAGLGPAVTFLYAGPAISVMAIIVTASILGFDIGASRAIAAVSSSIVIGLVMGTIFRGDARARQAPKGGEAGSSNRVALIFIAVLTAILLIGPASYIDQALRLALVAALTLAAAYVLKSRFSKEEIREFGYETWCLFKRIFPILLLGSFVSGVIGAIIPVEVLRAVFGTNSILSCSIAAVVGAFLYMPTILEVPIVGTLFGYSSGVMAAGPALALLLTGPTLSLPSMIVIWRTIGRKRAAAYFVLVAVLSAAMGLLFGMVLG